MEKEPIGALLAATTVLRVPKRRLSTFGATRIGYHLVSPGEGRGTRLREGTVVSERPKILTPEAFNERFEGFGDDAAEFAKWASAAYRDLLRALEYNFRNQGQSVRVLGDTPEQVADRIAAELDGKEAADEALVRCPDSGWSLALMKLTLDEAARSFPGHVRDLERRGHFDADGGELRRRRQLAENLFEKALHDPSALAELGAKLKEWGLFAEYEDRFLSLFAP